MLRHISVLLVSVLVLVALAASVALAAPPAGKGQPGATEEKSTGSPTDPNCWGEVTTQVAGPTYGEHASSFPTPRLGVGNVARNDSTDHDVEGLCSDVQTSEDNCDSGGHLSDHGCVAAAAPLPGFEPKVQPDCEAEPGGNRGPGS